MRDFASFLIVPRRLSRQSITPFEGQPKKANRLVSGSLILAGALVLPLAFGYQAGINRTDLSQNELSIAGREVVQVRVDFEAGAVAAAHRHPGEEIVYMIEGSLEYQVEGRAPVTLRAGDVLFIPAGAAHTVRNPSTGKAAELATYIVEKGKPLLTPAT